MNSCSYAGLLHLSNSVHKVAYTKDGVSFAREAGAGERGGGTAGRYSSEVRGGAWHRTPTDDALRGFSLLKQQEA